MPVTRIARRQNPRAPTPLSASQRAPSNGYPALPIEPKAAETDPLRYVLLLYGREKIGKTTWLSSFPDALFLTTEPGTKGLRIFEYNADDGGCRTWEHIRAAVALLETNPNRFRTVVIDTADRAYDLCMDYVCRALGIDHPGESADGRKDFGKSWKEVKKEFANIVHRILQTGRGLAFTSHAKEETFRSRGGDEFVRIHPTMSGQARGVVEALVDLFFYAEYMRAPDGTPRRVLITEGDELVWAGHRRIENADGELIRLPRLVPMTESGGFEVFRAAFAGEDVGLDPQTLLPGRAASDTVRKFFQNIRAAAVPAATKAAGRTPARKGN